MKLGSLFDGSGGFPLAGQMCGIEPIWASEIEEYPIRVTKKNFPNMKHLGDITKINGAEIDPVDIICGGSPCQGLSVAGVKKGLKDERSELFFEMIRVIKEMRDATGGKYPTFVFWENVAGSLTSTGGDDFRIVLEQFCRIAEEGVCIPRLEKWCKAGEILADGYSVSWRVLSAEYFGVPQIRRRVFLVMCFRGGGYSGEVLFKSKGMQRNFAEVRRSWQTAPTILETDIDKPITLQVRCGKSGGGKGALIQEDKSATLSCSNTQVLIDAYRETMNHGCIKDMKSAPLRAKGAGCGMGSASLVAKQQKRVRRLTPLECCRLQGFPDWWCDGVEGSDTAQYKMWGNGVALPCVLYIMEGIARVGKEIGLD